MSPSLRASGRAASALSSNHASPSLAALSSIDLGASGRVSGCLCLIFESFVSQGSGCLSFIFESFVGFLPFIFESFVSQPAGASGQLSGCLIFEPFASQPGPSIPGFSPLSSNHLSPSLGAFAMPQNISLNDHLLPPPSSSPHYDLFFDDNAQTAPAAVHRAQRSTQSGNWALLLLNTQQLFATRSSEAWAFGVSCLDHRKGPRCIVAMNYSWKFLKINHNLNLQQKYKTHAEALSLIKTSSVQKLLNLQKTQFGIGRVFGCLCFIFESFVSQPGAPLVGRPALCFMMESFVSSWAALLSHNLCMLKTARGNKENGGAVVLRPWCAHKRNTTKKRMKKNRTNDWKYQRVLLIQLDFTKTVWGLRGCNCIYFCLFRPIIL